MKKLLIFLLCVPMVGFGQRIWKSQDPNEKIISKEVIINGEIKLFLKITGYSENQLKETLY